MSVRIITDSTSDINQDRAAEWDVTLVPLKVIIDGEEYQDGVDMPLDVFYDRLVSSDKLPTTSQPAPEAFLKVFSQAKESQDSLVVITISSNISGTYQSALIAKDMCGYDDIHIVDSRQVTLSLQLLVRRAMELRADNRSGQEIAEILEQEKSLHRFYAVISDLSYLERGGRLSKVGAAAGSMLNLKPVITMQEEGTVKLCGMARGMNGAYGKLLKTIESDGGIDEQKEIIIGYTGNQEILQPFRSYLEGKIKMDHYLTSRIGTVIGTHGGPGCVVLSCVLKQRQE